MDVRYWVVVALAAVALAGCTSVRPEQTVAVDDGVQTEVAALVAQAQLRLALDEVTEGIQTYRRAVELAPEDGELAEEFGLALARAGMLDEARAQLSRAGKLTPAGAATLGIILVRGASSREQLERAARYLRQGLDAVPQGVQARFHLTQALVQLERGEEAWEVLQPLLSERPSDQRLQLLAGQALRLQGKPQEALEHLRRAEVGFDTQPRAAAEIADVLAQEGNYEEAAEKWKEVLDRQGSTLAGLARYAALLMRAGSAERARAVLDDILSRDATFLDALNLKAILAAGEGQLEEAADLYRRVLASQPDNAPAAMALARVLGDLRRTEEARSLLLDLEERAERGALPAGAGREIAEEAAALELLDRQPERALPWLEKIVGGPLGRRDVALWGEYFRQREAYREGLDWLRSAAIAEEPTVQRLRLGLEAELLLATGEEDEGMRILDTLLAGDSDRVGTAIGVLERRRRYDEVVSHARRAIERLGASAQLRFALAAGLERSGRWDEAVKEFRALIESQPDNPSVLNYLGYMFADRGVNLDEALALIGKAVEKAPFSGAYLDSLGWVHFRLGNLEKAEHFLTRAVVLEPHDATVQEHLGDLYAALGDAARARDHYQRALALEPDDEDQRERIEEKLVPAIDAKP